VPDEIELKLDVGPDGLKALDASGLLGDCTRETKLLATYFDTADRELWRNCVSLRLRKEGRRTLQTVKQPAVSGGGIAERREWEMPVKAGQLPVLDNRTPIPALLEAHGGPLQPVFEVHSLRKSWDLTAEDTQMEVAADDAEVVIDERRGPFREIEIEVRNGLPAAAFALARRIDVATPIRLGVLAKAERGFRMLGAQPEAEEADDVALDADMFPAGAFIAIAQSCLRQYRLNETILLDRQSGEAVHQARVALRRLRSAMVLFRELLPEEETRRLAARIRTLAHTFGEVRDFDVLAEETSPGTLRDRIEAARDDAYATLDGVLHGAEARHLIIDFAEWLATGTWRDDTAIVDVRMMPLRKFAAKALDRLRKKVRRHGRHLVSLDDETRHQLRKDVKKLRYGIEFLGGLFDSRDQEKRRKKFLKALKKLQQELGVLNDLVTAEQRLAALGLADTPEGQQFLAQWRRDKLRLHAADFRHDLLEEKPFWR
jgi:inorganic triphosphatase YgiF